MTICYQSFDLNKKLPMKNFPFEALGNECVIIFEVYDKDAA